MSPAAFIAENFYSLAELTWDISADLVLARFDIEDVRAQVQFERRPQFERPAGEWLVRYELLTSPKSIAYLAFNVFNGVFQAVEKFISVRQPRSLAFLAKRPELATIYEIYFRREESRLAEFGYRLLRPNDEPAVEYVLERIQRSSSHATTWTVHE